MQVSVAGHEKRDIEEAAGALGISTSRFIAQAALREAQVVLSAKRGLIASSQGLEARHQEILELVNQGEKGGPISMKAISERLGVSPSLLSRIMGEVENLALVSRERKGRRGVFVRLTEKGKRVWASARKGSGRGDSRL